MYTKEQANENIEITKMTWEEVLERHNIQKLRNWTIATENDREVCVCAVLNETFQ